MNNYNIDYAEPYRSGGEIFRVIIHQFDESKKKLGTFEIWATQEAIEDYLKIEKSPTRKQLLSFAADRYEKWMKECDYSPKTNGMFISNNRGIQYGDYHTFPGSVVTEEPMIRTNISLPQPLYEWVRYLSLKQKKSISETIRQSLKLWKFVYENTDKFKTELLKAIEEHFIEYDTEKEMEKTFDKLVKKETRNANSNKK